MSSVKFAPGASLTRGGGAVLVAVSLILSGCASTSSFAPPPLPTPQTFSGQPEAKGSVGAVGWRDFFQDPQLRGLIETALADNRDVRIAAARLDEARAALRIESAALYPSLDGVATSTRGRTPADLSIT